MKNLRASIPKTSIFSKIFAPTIAVMLLQVLLIAFTLIFNGTISSLDSSATESLYRNAENRTITLQNMMVHNWSNLDVLGKDISAAAQKYMEQTGLEPHEVFGNSAREKELLAQISDSLIYTMRTNMTTGIFAFFAGADVLTADEAALNGLYYRDFNPTMNPADYSDIQIEKGPAAVAQQSGIMLSSLWSEVYKLSASQSATWEAMFAPYAAALDNPQLKPSDAALWGNVHLTDPGSKMDTRNCITYTRPLYCGDLLIGIVGIEIQLEHLEKYFPPADVGEMGGYILVNYDNSAGAQEPIMCGINAITGSYIKRLTGIGKSVELMSTDDEHYYTINAPHFEKTTMALQNIKLYNSNVPFSHEQWALAAIMPDSVLFKNSNNLRNGIVTSSLISIVLGGLLLFIAIRTSTKPLLSIAAQIEHGNADVPVVVGRTSTYEINLLCETINEMKRRRKDVEKALREEGERYLLALESAIDAFIEYDISNDRLRIYFFADVFGNQQLTSRVIDELCGSGEIGKICHPYDVREFSAALRGISSGSCQMRIRADIFGETEEGERTDDGYIWFDFKAMLIGEKSDLDEALNSPQDARKSITPARVGGEITKTIGSAMKITEQKLEEFARIEASRRDLTTGAYNREYGMLIMTGQTSPADIGVGDEDSVAAITISNYEKLEAYYGRVFASAVLRDIVQQIKIRAPQVSGLIRWGNAELVGFCEQGYVDEYYRILKDIEKSVYIGESAEISISLDLGIGKMGDEPEEEMERAFAASYSSKAHGGAVYASSKYDAALKLFRSSSSQYTGIEFSKESIVSTTFSLFENTNDVKSVMRMLVRLIGEIYGLHRIVICEYDEDFGANQINYQWAAEGLKPYSADLERIAHTDFAQLVKKLDQRGVYFYNTHDVSRYSEGLRKLLCVPKGGSEFASLCCAMYENGLQTGRALYISTDVSRVPSEAELHSLYEVTKIVSTRFNLDKSNSASRAKSEFLSKMSHEIRTPMNAIIGLTRIAKEAGQNEEQIRSSLDKIDMSAKHLLSLINDILDMSRIESGKLTIDSRPFAISQMLESIDVLMRPQFDEKSLSLEVVSEVTHDSVAGDNQKLAQTLINLLSNAYKFTLPGGHAVLKVVQLDGDTVDGMTSKYMFSVKDNGVGIAKDDQYNIFHAFEQASATNEAAGNPKGTGLGLAICNNFVAAMGGRMELRSDRGEGTEFFFTLELPKTEQKREAPRAQKSEKPSAERFRGMKVLIVDDNEINLEIAVYLIEDYGFTCEVARDGKEAVDKYLANPSGYYCAVFMDINMPVMDGFTATREIRKRADREDSRKIPIIAMTANAFSEDTRKSLDAGMNAHVAKPIDVEFMYETLERLLG